MNTISTPNNITMTPKPVTTKTETTTTRIEQHKHVKPLATTSPEAIAAANEVTPQRLSDLLLLKGPLAIRYITKELGKDIPCFKDLSASKQRRLIMSAMDAGDIENHRLFEKIGWGQWSIRVVPSFEFETQRKLINAKNLEVKYLHQSNPNDSSANKKRHLNETADDDDDDPITKNNKSLYIDENAVHSEEEEEEEEEGQKDQTGNQIKTKLSPIAPKQKCNSLSPIQSPRIIRATVVNAKRRLHSFSAFDNHHYKHLINQPGRRHSTIVYVGQKDNNVSNKFNSIQHARLNDPFKTEHFNVKEKTPKIPFLITSKIGQDKQRSMSTSSMGNNLDRHSNKQIIHPTNSLESSIRSTLVPSRSDMTPTNTIATTMTNNNNYITNTTHDHYILNQISSSTSSTINQNWVPPLPTSPPLLPKCQLINLSDVTSKDKIDCSSDSDCDYSPTLSPISIHRINTGNETSINTDSKLEMIDGIIAKHNKSSHDLITESIPRSMISSLSSSSSSNNKNNNNNNDNINSKPMIRKDSQDHDVAFLLMNLRS